MARSQRRRLLRCDVSFLSVFRASDLLTVPKTVCDKVHTTPVCRATPPGLLHTTAVPLIEVLVLELSMLVWLRSDDAHIPPLIHQKAGGTVYGRMPRTGGRWTVGGCAEVRHGWVECY